MDINSIKTKVKQHKHITLKQKDNASPIELILCGEDGRPLTSLSGACTISLLDLVDKQVRSKINGQVNAGVVSFKVTDHLKANKHSIEIDVGGRKFPSDGEFIVQVSMSHDQVELSIISSQTATTVMNGLYDKIITYMNANPNLFRGLDGKDGKPFTYDMFTSAQLAALKGDKGDKGEPFKFTDFTKSQLDTINTQVASILQPSIATQVQSEFSKLSAKQQQEAEVINARNSYESLDARLDATDNNVTNNKIELAKAAMKPKFVEYFGSFSRYGIGVPSGVANYSGGKYVLNVTGNAGDTFVTVTSGNIADGGGVWPCVIQNDDGIFDLNKVMSNDGVNKLNLNQPLKRTITNGKLGNLHDANLGQHYTELGYYAYTQHFYFANPRFTERDKVLSQFLPTDTVTKWVTNAYISFASSGAVVDTNNLLNSVGSKFMSLNFNDSTKYAEWEETINGLKGYLELFIGLTTGTVKIEFMLDDVVVDTRMVSKPIDRYVFPFENAKKGKIRVTSVSGTPLPLRVGRTTWFLNEKYQPLRLINPSDKVVYIGDSWGEFHNQATTRELERLMRADGGSPIIWNYSKGGHTSKYAKEGFQKYVIDNKPDKVIIEYFTNDFNSINGTVLSSFTATDGTQQDMNIKDINEYLKIMQWMIDKAIENGIQPIIIMPNATNATGQVQSFMDFANQIWNGTLITVEEAYYKKLSAEELVTPLLKSKNSSGVGTGTLALKSKEVNSAIRKGVYSDTDTGANVTGGDIHGFYNNGVRKSGVKYDGSIEIPFIRFVTSTTVIAANAANVGMLYFVKSATTNNQTEIWTVVEKADGTFAQAKLNMTVI